MLGARRWSKIITNKECKPFPLGLCVIVVEKKPKSESFQLRTWLPFMLLINNSALKLFFSIWDWVCNHRQENVGTFISFHVYTHCKNVVHWIGARRWSKIITNKGYTPSPLGQCVIVVEKAKVWIISTENMTTIYATHQ